ncbi:MULTISPECIES: sensor histidine kinase [Bacillaceae]|uniref:sensor histidine kinase n=1 Tax=Bacillaceae TaxID=186817 RepID=UPI0006FE332A|nr:MULTISPECIES: sensor histidine kinase [Bacillaceae]KQL37524.1 histidine kinase [Psychrobacillus sp. FJAT-21963]MDF2068553.1 sensor histidine kinase [Bacillus sp. Cr_A10]
MTKWYQVFPKYPWLSIYAWIVFCIFPFFFIFKSSSQLEIIIGLILTLLFFIVYRSSFTSKGILLYICVFVEIAISVSMTFLYGYIYFSIFLSFFIGNIQQKANFFVIYSIHLVAMITAVIIGFFTQMELFLSHMPFLIICLIGVILLPFNTYNRNKREVLEGQLEDAQKRISRYIIIEERERIARDLHDTLGQKLSLIGLKSDLASRLIEKNPEAAKNEINDINQTARSVLKEVRELVTNMRGTKLEEELFRVKQILLAAQIDCKVSGTAELVKTPLLVENVLSMCLKEAVTNVVKHSNATSCSISIKQSAKETLLKIHDNGTGLVLEKDWSKGHGLRGIKERLEFVNGSFDIHTKNGTTLNIRVPNVIQQSRQEE